MLRVCRHYCVVNRTQVERQTAKCSALDRMAMLGSTLDRQASRLDGYTDSELMAKFDSWVKNPDSSPDCIFYK